MIDFWIRKLSSVTLLTLGILWSQPSLAESISITRIYDQNQGKGVKVVVRTKVLNQDNEPISRQLSKDDFQIKSNQKVVENKDFTVKQPNKLLPDPSRIIILLDVTGSMTSPDQSGKMRGIAALSAIRNFLESIKNYPTKVSLVPFAEGGKGCNERSYLPPSVNSTSLAQFFPPNSVEINQEIAELESKFKAQKEFERPCGSTNIREPLNMAIQYLKTQYGEPTNSSSSQMRLGIILISDGYDPVLNAAKKYNNRPELTNLESLLKENSTSITVYTLGYGLKNSYKEPEKVDTAVLQRLAKASGGSYRFSGDETEIIEALNRFLRAFLGEYEIVYTPTITESNSQQTVEISVAGVSTSERFRLQNFPTLLLAVRVVILGGTLVFCFLFGYLPFKAWCWWLERNA